jgi:prepilin-type N-terminal cleavage/methylation domain-containing protein
MKKQQNKSEGFTIIEVLIVLAIAGLIMLIVFLAVPALQRNSRNTQRNSDASLLASAVNECLNNRNGQIASCNDVGNDDNLGAFVDTTRLSQLTAPATPGGAAAVPGSDTTITNEANIYFGARCAPDGAGPDGGGGLARDYVVLFRVEGTGGSLPRCISS